MERIATLRNTDHSGESSHRQRKAFSSFKKNVAVDVHAEPKATIIYDDINSKYPADYDVIEPLK